MIGHPTWWTLAVAACLAAVSFRNAQPILAQESAKPAAEKPAADDARIAELIQRLGAEEFTERERAQGELAELGLAAFDALHSAQNDNDPEISLRARHLVRSMNVRWFQESDPPEVVKILRGYGDQSDGERRTRIDHLARLENRLGIVPLCRLARFETNDVLSKAAALKVMEHEEVADAAVRDELAKSIVDVVGSSQRPGERASSTWLRLYARTLANPAEALADWDIATTAEQASMEKHPDKTSVEIVRDLYRWQVELLKRQGKDQEAVAVIRRTFKLLEGTPEQVKELVGWLIHAQKYDVVLEAAERFKTTFDETPELLYRLAETHLKLGRADEAKTTADRALAIRPENLEEHLLVANKLQETGLHDWAEREFRHVIQATPAGQVLDFRARFYLSEMLHDQARELDAAQALQPLCDLMDKDPAAKDICIRAGRDEPEGVYSRMHFFYACDLISRGQAAEAEARLDQAVAKDATDADALIALYRLPNQSPERKEKTKQLIETTARQFREQLDSYKLRAEQAPSEQFQANLNFYVAFWSNQLAWLVGNTFGDYDEAVKLSQRSLEIRPEYPGYLDTLGRCYYATGDLENAIKYQSQAVKLDPHSGQMQRQLEFFKQEQAAKGGVKP
jgi:tetratricopeptide (TPR) repeat protein